jgi:hypothetical protein
MTTVILLSAATLALIFFLLLLLVRGAPRSFSRAPQLKTGLRHVDVVAFRNLMDPEEEAYLRASLLPKEFRAIQRERLRAALEYVGVVAQNAAILIRLGEAAGRSPDTQVAQMGKELLDSALRLRVTTLLVRARILIGILLPTVHISSARVTDSYENLTGMASRLTRLQQNPPVASVP